MAKHEKISFSIKNSYFNLEETIESALDTLKYISDTKQVTTSLLMKPKCRSLLGHIYGDQKRINQVILNFVSNSLKFTNQGGFVKLEVGIIKVQPANAGNKTKSSFYDDAVSAQRSSEYQLNHSNLGLVRSESMLNQINETNEKTYIVDYYIRIQDNGPGISEKSL